MYSQDLNICRWIVHWFVGDSFTVIRRCISNVVNSRVQRRLPDKERAGQRESIKWTGTQFWCGTWKLILLLLCSFPFLLVHCISGFLIVSVLSSKEVAETPAKKSRRGKEPSVAHSPSLRQGKQAAESNPRVIFTGLVDKQGEKVDCADTLFKPTRFIWYWIHLETVITQQSYELFLFLNLCFFVGGDKSWRWTGE